MSFFNHDLKTVKREPRDEISLSSPYNKTHVHVDKFESFERALKSTLKVISDHDIVELYNKFVKSRNHKVEITDWLITEAVNYYLDQKLATQDHANKDKRPHEQTSNNKRQIDEPPQQPHRQSKQSMQEIQFYKKAKYDISYSENSKKDGIPKLERSWRRYIGSLQVDCWCTRSVYGQSFNDSTKLHLSKRPNNNNVVYVSLTKQNREIGRCSEETAKIVGPLMEYNLVEFESFMVYSPDSTLRTGDTFVIQVDCFLSSSIFNNANLDDENEDDKLVRSLMMVQKNNNKEVIDVHSSDKRLTLSMLFNKVSLKKISNQETEKEKEKDKEQDQHETITLDSDEENDDDSYSDAFDELKKNYNIAKNQKQTTMSEDGEEDGKLLSLNQLRDLYKTTESTGTKNKLPETYPFDFKLNLRPYQRNGLSWMLKREHEYGLIGSNNPDVSKEDKLQQELIASSEEGFLNPLWREYKFPKNKSKNVMHADVISQQPTNFYFNLYSGSCSFIKPMIKSDCMGGILADEMGLGKTITTLSLVLTCPKDESYVLDHKAKYAHQTTLIIVPMALLSQWESEFGKANSNAKNKCYIYYGNDTLGDLTNLLCRNENPPTVVLTTYGTVQSEWSRINRSGINSNSSGLFSVKFFRIIIDEGHNIRNKATKTAKSIYTLDASRRWILTGTPVINRLDDFYSLIRYLKLQPWSHYSLWKYFITTPFDSGKDLQLAFSLLKTILDPLLLRRTKNQRDETGNLLVELPPKQVIIETLSFNEKERVLYDWLKARAVNSLKDKISKGLLLKNYSSILTHLLRLRQVCDHVDLITMNDSQALADELETKDQKHLTNDLDAELIQTVKSIEAEEKQDSLTLKQMIELKKQIYETYPTFDDSIECSICTNEIQIDTCVMTECKHCFCLSCLMGHFDFQKRRSVNNRKVNENRVGPILIDDGETHVLCPMCRNEIKKTRLFRTLPIQFRKNDVQDDEIEKQLMTQANISFDRDYFVRPYNPYGKSTKLNALISHLLQIKEDTPGDHVIVFSQFTAYLDIIEKELNKYRSDFDVLKFDGRLNLDKRQQVLRQFGEPVSSSNKISVLLLSLKAGGVGLNLTVASKAFLLDPHWNTATEFQAIDRLHRVGQTNSVKVIRFIMEDSIEERMLKIQERKNQLGEAIAINDEERRKRRIEEIQSLFAE